MKLAGKRYFSLLWKCQKPVRRNYFYQLYKKIMHVPFYLIFSFLAESLIGGGDGAGCGGWGDQISLKRLVVGNGWEGGVVSKNLKLGI